MKNKIDISQLIRNYDNEFDNRLYWLNVHISLMFNEVHEIQNTLYIFETVEKEWNRRAENGERISYSPIRTTLYEALPYKIILGLSKIFVGGKEFSLLKTISVISQMDEYKDSKQVKELTRKIQTYLETSEMIKVITTYRDQFFAHLDKVSVLSDCRIDTSVAIKEIDKLEIDKGIELIRELYKVCFNKDLEHANKELSEKDIIYTFFWM